MNSVDLAALRTIFPVLGCDVWREWVHVEDVVEKAERRGGGGVQWSLGVILEQACHSHISDLSLVGSQVVAPQLQKHQRREDEGET